jgi:hypothetical protein
MVGVIKGTERVELIVRRRARPLLIAVVALCSTAANLVISAGPPADAAVGPPALPSANYQVTGGYSGSCANAAAVSTACPAGLSAINVSRAAEGVIPMSLPTNFAALTGPEQVFVVTDLERVDRGLPPIQGLSSTLDAEAQAGVAGSSDPDLPGYGTSKGANWGESANLFSTFELWMYQDGWAGSATTNEACTSPAAAGCWAHRANILAPYSGPAMMGAAVGGASTGVSVAQVLVGGDTQDTPYFTWGDVMAHLPVGVTDASVNVSSPPGSSQVGSVQLWASGEAMTVGLTISGGNGVFSMGSPGGCNIPIGHSCQAAIDFSPPSIGEYTANLSISGPNGVQNVPLVGVASRGYRLVGADGGIFTYGGANFLGSTGAMHLNRPIVGMADDQQTGGYWMVASDGGIFTFGAGFFGSAGGLGLTSPVVGMAATPDGGGYWLVTASGGVFSFGDAQFHGAAANLGAPVVGIAATPDGGGYWLVTASGGVLTYGDAQFYGSAGAMRLNRPVVAMAATPDGGGYWLVASDGGIFNYGDAAFYGSTGGFALNRPIVGLATTPDGGGYWLVASDGGVFNFGDAGFYGSTGAMRLNSPVVGLVVGQQP